MANWICPYCKKIICEDIEKSEINEGFVECPYCRALLKNPNKNN